MSEQIEQQEQVEQRITVIGITGNIGCGKSEVSRILRNLGSIVLSSDDTAKKCMDENDEIRLKIRKLFGIHVFSGVGLINHAALAQRVFGDTPEHRKALQELNNIVHPAVLESHFQTINEYALTGLKHIFIESALIYETGIEDAFDYIVVVDAPEETRLQRALQRGTATKEQISARMKNQMNAGQKKNLADFTIDNSGSLEQLEQSVLFLLPIFTSLPPTMLYETEEND